MRIKSMLLVSLTNKTIENQKCINVKNLFKKFIKIL